MGIIICHEHSLPVAASPWCIRIAELPTSMSSSWQGATRRSRELSQPKLRLPRSMAYVLRRPLSLAKQIRRQPLVLRS